MPVASPGPLCRFTAALCWSQQGGRGDLTGKTGPKQMWERGGRRALAREAPRGRRSISRPPQHHRLALGGPDAIPSEKYRRYPRWPVLQPGRGRKVHALIPLAPLRPSAARAARSRASSAPTFVSSQLCQWHHLVRFVGSLQIWVGANKAVAVISQAKLARNRWEQSLLAKRRAGGARSQDRHSIIAWHLEALMQSPARNIDDIPDGPSCNRVGAERCMP